MTTKYWDRTHVEKYSKADWVTKPSIFAEQCIEFFPETGNLLEIGAGQGGDAEFFKSLGYEVTATDYSEEALKIAEGRVKGVKFLNVDTEDGLPFEDQSFDIVYSHLALHYFDAETTKKVFNDVRRILKPDGIFATITNTLKDPEIEEYQYTKLEDNYYEDPKGVKKRYFSVAEMSHFTDGLFEPIMLDELGSTYKDLEPNLVRFIGRRQ